MGQQVKIQCGLQFSAGELDEKVFYAELGVDGNNGNGFSRRHGQQRCCGYIAR
jgi:hypothetical protein